LGCSRAPEVKGLDWGLSKAQKKSISTTPAGRRYAEQREVLGKDREEDFPKGSGSRRKKKLVRIERSRRVAEARGPNENPDV